jgi:hypothetical protein
MGSEIGYIKGMRCNRSGALTDDVRDAQRARILAEL